MYTDKPQKVKGIPGWKEDCREKKYNCIQINETPSLKEEGETVANLVLLEVSRDYKIKGKKLYIITVLKLIKLHPTII